jgi:PAS domain S-box-containing protein
MLVPDDATPIDLTLLEKLARQVPGVLYQFQRFPDGRSCFPFASAGMREIYEVEPDDVREDATPVFRRLHPGDLDRVAATIEESARALTPWRCTYRVSLPSRGVRWVQGDARPERLSDGSILWHGHITDVTDIELARQALRESEERYRILVEHAPEAIVVFDTERNRLVDVNENAERLFRLPRAQLLERDVPSLSAPVQPDGRASEVAAPPYITRALAGERPVFEWLHRTADGEDILCEIRLVTLPFDGRTLVRGSITDIRARKRLDDMLRRLEAAIASSLSAIAVADLAGNLTYVNEAFLRMWGHTDASDVLGRPATSFWHAPDEAQQVVEALYATGTWTGELTARRTDGVLRTLMLQANLFRDGGGQPLGLLASFVDVTEERTLQAQLQQAQRLESVGRLAGGVAHDFNNLLTVMKGYLELSLTTLRPDDPLTDNLREVDHAVDSAASLTQQLLAFSRRQVIAPRVLDLNDVVRRALGMLQRVLGEHITVECVAAPDLGHVRFDPAQAEQVLVNLAVNARDAMPEGGRLTIETANVTLDEAYLARHPDAVAGEYVVLAVSDTGVGMSRETREHAFEPFYTTKLPGHGTGLGLAMIHGAVSQNGGRIEVYSELGHGTSFKIYLPRVTEDGLAEPGAPVAASPRGSERILVVEDDPHVRALTERLLRRFGYEVITAGDGEEALAWLTQHGLPVDLLLTDVIMPSMNGKVLAERVLAMRPDTRVLFTSGYTANVIVQHGVLKPGVEFLPKPFTTAALAQRVREVLDGRSAADAT